MCFGHHLIYFDSRRRYLVDLISGGVFPHSHGQRSLVGHRYPQLHVGHAVKVLIHKGGGEKVVNASVSRRQASDLEAV